MRYMGIRALLDNETVVLDAVHRADGDRLADIRLLALIKGLLENVVVRGVVAVEEILQRDGEAEAASVAVGRYVVLPRCVILDAFSWGVHGTLLVVVLGGFLLRKFLPELPVFLGGEDLLDDRQNLLALTQELLADHLGGGPAPFGHFVHEG